MAKRFVDTDIWQKEWFQDLTLKEKILVKYIFENCDCAGVWNINLKLASFIIGEPITMEDIITINNKKMQFEPLENGNLYVIDFIKFQYGKLSEVCKPHKPIIEKLKKYNLYEKVSKGYSNGINTLEEKEQEQEQEQEQDKEKEKEQEKEKEKEQEKEQEKEKEKEQKLYGEYSNVFLTSKNYGKLLSMCASEKLLNELINSFSSAIEVGKERPYTAELPNAHFERLKSYYNYRKRNPERFKESEESKEDFWGKLAKQYEGRELVV